MMFLCSGRCFSLGFISQFCQYFSLQMRELVSGLHHNAAVHVVIFRSLVSGVFCAGQLSSVQQTDIRPYELNLFHLSDAVAFAM